jgi:uncharacterized membrane protein
MNRLARTLLQGLAIFLPLVLTGWVLWKAFRLVDQLLPFSTPGFGFAAVLGIVLLLGLAADNWLTASILRRMESLLERVPLVRLVYRSIREITSSLTSERRPFHNPVLVRPWPGSEARLLGFVTRQDLSDLGLPGWISVYVPNAYAIAGQTFIVPADQVEPLEVEPSAAMTFAMSAGVAGPREA